MHTKTKGFSAGRVSAPSPFQYLAANASLFYAVIHAMYMPSSVYHSNPSLPPDMKHSIVELMGRKDVHVLEMSRDPEALVSLPI